VLAAHNYPGSPRVGDVITGGDGEGILHAGTARGEDGSVISAGGRVLSVVATGTDLAAARDAVYRRLAGIGLPGGHFRSDIALAAVKGTIAL
jgi:phosphoribosylamine--glycine ligase